MLKNRSVYFDAICHFQPAQSTLKSKEKGLEGLLKGREAGWMEESAFFFFTGKYGIYDLDSYVQEFLFDPPGEKI